MKHIHFDSIDSTQTYLKDHLITLENEDRNILISCNKQTNGIGRTGNSWIQFNNSLAMSFTFAPNSILTLSTIELGLISIAFLKSKFHYDAKLKWPNDLYSTENEKIGGIITNFYNEKILIAGLGINFGEFNVEDLKSDYRVNSIKTNSLINLKETSVEFYSFILKNRISNELICDLFAKNCFHLNKAVEIDSGEQKINGKFIGINQNGEALIEFNGQSSIINHGHLRVIE